MGDEIDPRAAYPLIDLAMADEEAIDRLLKIYQ